MALHDAVVIDLLPALIRWIFPEKNNQEQQEQ